MRALFQQTHISRAAELLRIVVLNIQHRTHFIAVARLKAAVVIDPAAFDLTEVAFGLCVTVADESGTETTYEIVGEDELRNYRFVQLNGMKGLAELFR